MNNSPESQTNWVQPVIFLASAMVGFLVFKAAAPGLTDTLVNRSNFQGNALGEMTGFVRDWLIPLVGAGTGALLAALAIGAGEHFC